MCIYITLIYLIGIIGARMETQEQVERNQPLSSQMRYKHRHTRTYTTTHISAWAHSAPQPHRLTSHNEMLAPYAPALSKHSSTACCYLLASVEFTHLVLFYKIELTAICEISAEQMVTNHYFPFV